MSYIPAVPLSGLVGYRFLERTDETQRAAHANSAEIKRDLAYFNENIKKVETVDDLINDRQLLKVALGAFGLGDEIDKKAFVRKALVEGVTDTNAFANRLNDQRYRDAAKAFAFDSTVGPNTRLDSLKESVASKYLEQTYEVAIGDQNDDLRLALNFKRQAADVGARGWYAVLGDLPTRKVLQTALNLPDDIASLDIDKQVDVFESRAKRLLNIDTLSDLDDPAVRDKVISRFLLINEALSGPNTSTPGYAALQLLQNASGFGSGAIQGLVLSSAR